MKLREAYDFAKTEEGLSAARKYLSKIKEQEGRLLLLYARLENMKKKGVSLSAWHDTPRNSSQTGDPTANFAVRAADLEKEIEEAIKDLMLLKKEVQHRIGVISDKDIQKALTFHYIDHITACAGAGRLYMDERQYFRKLRRGCMQIAMQLALEGKAESYCAHTAKML